MLRQSLKLPTRRAGLPGKEEIGVLRPLSPPPRRGLRVALPVAVMARLSLALFLAGLLSAALPAPPCQGSDRPSAGPTITLDVQHEPLRSVLGRISQTTRWKITAPDKWMDKPVTQRLERVPLEEGLRFILRDAGVENLLLTYDEIGRTVTVHDTEVQPGKAANLPPVPGAVRLPAVPAGEQQDPILRRHAEDAGNAPARPPRSRSRRQSRADEE